MVLRVIGVKEVNKAPRALQEPVAFKGIPEIKGRLA